MSMLTVNQEQALSLRDYEIRISLYREQIGTGYIGIGRTLTEAKEAKVVPHGEWESWVERTTGLTARQAQRCMQAAAEIREGSAMARLEMSKALLLLGSGLDEETREEVAGRAAEEGATVRQLREEIRQLKDRQEAEQEEAAEAVKALKLQVTQEAGATAEIRIALKQATAERDSLAQQMKAQIAAYQQRMDQIEEEAYRRGMKDQESDLRDTVRKEFQGKIDHINGERKQAEERIRSLQEALDAERKDGSARWDAGFKAGTDRMAQVQKTLESAWAETDRLKRNQADLLEAAEAAEKRAADAEAELEALKTCAPERSEPAWKIIRTAADRFLADCEMLPIQDAAGVLRGEQQIEGCLERLEMWLNVMRETLAGCVVSEGAVE